MAPHPWHTFSVPQKESQKADEYLREIQELGQLTQAVQQCIEAAGHEHRPDMQKSLLRVGLDSRAGGRGCWAGSVLVGGMGRWGVVVKISSVIL